MIVLTGDWVMIAVVTSASVMPAAASAAFSASSFWSSALPVVLPFAATSGSLSGSMPVRSIALLSEVVTSWGEHHLVLVVRAKGGDIVLDNLNAQIRNWSQARYRWVRMQTPANPDHWAAVAQAGA